MLVLTRAPMDDVFIWLEHSNPDTDPPDLVLTYLGRSKHNRDGVRIGISGDKKIKIVRKEAYEASQKKKELERALDGKS